MDSVTGNRMNEGAQQREASQQLSGLSRRLAYGLKVPKAPVLLKSPTAAQEQGCFDIRFPEDLTFDALADLCRLPECFAS